jgi:hypothetical protein
VLRVHQKSLKASRFEDLVERNPKHTGGFHRDQTYSAFLQPVDQFMQVARGRLERSHRLRVAIRWDSNEDLFSTDIHASGSEQI